MKGTNNNCNNKSRNKYRGKGSKRSYKGSERNKSKNSTINNGFSKEEKTEEGYINNPSYYYGDNTVLDQVMNFSFNQFGGVQIEVNATPNTIETCFNPMIASIHLNPSIPESVLTAPNEIQGVQTAALRNYLMLSGSNAKTTNYAPQDVILLELALAEIIKMSTFFARAFGIAYLFNYRNRTYPESLLRAMGIDAADFRANLAQYRIQFNTLLALASKIPFPAEIPLFAKAANLYGSIYLDDDNSALAQTYLFTPRSVWQYNETYDLNGAGLDMVWWHVGACGPLSGYLSKFESCINSLLTSTALNYIYSDVMRLVQNGKVSKLLTFASIPENFVIVPVYNEEIKDWVHNSVIMGDPLLTSNQYTTGATYAFTNENDVCCDAGTNRVLYHPQFEVPTKSGYGMLIDFDHDNVTVEEKVRATRLSARWTVVYDSVNTKFYTDEIALMDEYVVGIAFIDGTETGIIGGVSGLNYSTKNFNSATYSKEDVVKWCYYLSKFDWAPLLYLRDNAGKVYPIGDLDYYTILDYSTVRRIYDYEIIHFLQIG